MKCGVGDYTASLASALSRCQNTSVAVLTDEAANQAVGEFDFEVLPVAEGWRMSDVVRIGAAARRWNPDIVHVQYPTQGYGERYLPWLLPAIFRLLNVPVVQTWHEYNLDKMKRNIFNAALAGRLIAVRPDYRASMSGWCRWLTRRKRFEFIPSASSIPTVLLSEAERLDVKARFGSESARLIAYFGFVYPPKRVELLFEIADPSKERIILICDLNSADEYQKTILDRINREPWAGKVTVTGFLPREEVGRVLAAADAVVLPFRDGGGQWNTSILAAISQGTFLLTTSRERYGYQATENVYFARPDDVDDMRIALRTFIGKKVIAQDKHPVSDWKEIANAHRSLYESILFAA